MTNTKKLVSEFNELLNIEFKASCFDKEDSVAIKRIEFVSKMLAIKLGFMSSLYALGDSTIDFTIDYIELSVTLDEMITEKVKEID